MNESNSINIKYIITLLLNHIKLIIFMTVLGAAAGYCVSKYVLPLKYTSNITLYVQSYTDVRESTYNVNNISNSKQLVNTYIDVLVDDAVMDAVGQQLFEQFDANTLAANFSFLSVGEISPASIRRCLAVSTGTDTSAIKVVATANDPEVAAYICNAIIDVAPKYMMEAVGVGSINTIRRAKTYYGPVSPNNKVNTVTGGAVGLMLIVLFILLHDYFDNTVKDPDVLKERYQKAVIGEIRQYGEAAQKKRDPDRTGYFRLTDENMPFDIVESFKSIRTNVTFSLSTRERKIFAVSSSNLGDGKSTTCSNIAIATAQSGSRVLLIDADMRKPVQHIIFKLNNKKGLSTAAGRIDPPDKCIQKKVMENLDVMTSGPVPPNPSELLASAQMAAILDDLSKKYDVIIIDTPPVNVVTDAMELAKYDVGIVMVVRYGVTTDEDLKIASKKIELADMKMFGFILNGAKQKRNGAYYSRSRYKKALYYKKSYAYTSYGKEPETGTAKTGKA